MLLTLSGMQAGRTFQNHLDVYLQYLSDEAIIMSLLEANDAVCDALKKYESIALA